MNSPLHEQPINFMQHQIRAGVTGARDDFEQMIGLLVRATTNNETHLLARGPDWGIDVLTGQLDGKIAIWQAKYPMNDVAAHNRRMFTESFHAALRASQMHRHQVEKWTLCIPHSFSPGMLQWWQKWREDQRAASGVLIDLWDENELRSLLLRPESAHVRRHFYSDGMDGETAFHRHLLDAWSAVDNLARVPRGRVKIEWLAELTGLDELDIELSRRARNSVAHDGHRGVSFSEASRALEVAHMILIKLPRPV